MADFFTVMQNAEEAAELKKKRTFRKFSYRGIDLDQYVLVQHSTTIHSIDAAVLYLLPAALPTAHHALRHK